MTNYSDLPNEEIDRLIAERVCQWEHSEHGQDWKIMKGDRLLYWSSAPKFTTSFDTCLEHVIPAMRELGFSELEISYKSEFKVVTSSFNYEWMGRCINKSLPRATCEAALMALDAMNNNKEEG